MTTNNILNEGAEALTYDEYRIQNLFVPRPKPTTEVENFLVRPPAQSQVLVIKKSGGARLTDTKKTGAATTRRTSSTK